MAAAVTGTSAVRQLVQLKGVGYDQRVGVARRRLESGARSGIDDKSADSRVCADAATTVESRQREQGISRAGNARLQAISIQLAWNWVRWQPLSALTRWYQAHFGKGKRARRLGIVAVARKLVIALWRYVTIGVSSLRERF